MIKEINEKIGKYRWTICALVFFATTVNYLDRQVLSLLKDRLEVQFNWSDSDYANIVIGFSVCICHFHAFCRSYYRLAGYQSWDMPGR